MKGITRPLYVLVLMMFAACGGGNAKATPMVTITYRVGGFATSPKLTYRTASGTTERDVGDAAHSASLNEDVKVDVPAGTSVSMSLEIRYLGGDNVRCTIIGSAGQTLADNSATGAPGNKAECEAKAA